MVEKKVHLSSVQEIKKILKDVKDPELPALSLVELKIIQDIVITDDTVLVKITPTFLGCPALEQMKRDIIARLQEAGVEKAVVEVIFSPAWSTDMLDDEVREKLRRFGIAPPPQNKSVQSITIHCPHCGSTHTRLESPFGPTLCKQMYYCTSCQQMFERFKPL